MPRPVQYPSSLMHWPMEQEDASDATYATHVTGTFGSPVGASSSIFGSPTLSHLTLHEPSTISTVPLSYGVLPVGASVHDTLPINHSINHGILQASTNLELHGAAIIRGTAGRRVGSRHPADQSFDQPRHSDSVDGPRHRCQRFKTSADGQPGCAAQGRHDSGRHGVDGPYRQP